MLTNITRTLAVKDKGFSLKTLLQHKFSTILLKLILSLGLVGILYYQIFGREDLTIQKLGQEFLAQISWTNMPLVVLVLILMPLNWFFETQKWLALMRRIEPIQLGTALKTVLIGLTCSLFTPNRVGEYGGRIMLVSKEKRFRAVFAVLIGASSQWIVLILGGWWALVGACYWGFINLTLVDTTMLLAIGIVASLFLWTIYFNLSTLVYYCLRFKWTRKWAIPLQQSLLESYTHKELLQALAYSVIRYLTYSFQYVCLLYFFGFEASIVATFLGVLVVYLLQTGIPLPPSTGLLARGNIALLIFGYISISNSAPSIILASTFSLWLINVVLPGVIGGFFMMQLGWNNQGKEQEIKDSCPVI